MDIQIHAINFDADDKLKEYINSKVGKLTKFHDHILDADVFLKFDNMKPVKDKIVEIKMNVPGSTLFATDKSKSFEEATDLASESLRRQLKKYREKLGK